MANAIAVIIIAIILAVVLVGSMVAAIYLLAGLLHLVAAIVSDE